MSEVTLDQSKDLDSSMHPGSPEGLRNNNVPIHLLYLMRDELPPFRVDVSALFGIELPRLGVTSDLLGQASAGQPSGTAGWPAGAMWLVGRARPGIFGEALRPFKDLIGLLRRLNRRHDIIQVRDKIRSGLLALCVARLSGRRFVYWMSFPFAEDYEYRFRLTGRSRGWLVWAAYGLRALLAKPVLYKLVARHADHLFVQSEAMRDFLATKGIPFDKMNPVPMGVDAGSLEAVVPLETRPERLRDRRVIVYSGALSRSRNSDFLLHVLCEVRKTTPNVLLMLVGDADNKLDSTWFRERLEHMGLADWVWVTGWMPREQALQYVKCAEIGLSPIPRGELFDVSSPTKAVEYLALSIPCVGNEIPDQRLVIEQSGGGLCVPMEVPAFASAVSQLLDDAEHAARLGAQGRRWVFEHRAYRRIAEPIADVYIRLLGTGRRASVSARVGS